MTTRKGRGITEKIAVKKNEELGVVKFGWGNMWKGAMMEPEFINKILWSKIRKIKSPELILTKKFFPNKLI